MSQKRIHQVRAVTPGGGGDVEILIVSLNPRAGASYRLHDDWRRIAPLGAAEILAYLVCEIAKLRGAAPGDFWRELKPLIERVLAEREAGGRGDAPRIIVSGRSN